MISNSLKLAYLNFLDIERAKNFPISFSDYIETKTILNKFKYYNVLF